MHDVFLPVAQERVLHKLQLEKDSAVHAQQLIIEQLQQRLDSSQSAQSSMTAELSFLRQQHHEQQVYISCET